MPSLLGVAYADHRAPPASRKQNRIPCYNNRTDVGRFSEAQRERTNGEACLRPLSARGRIRGVLSERSPVRPLCRGRRLPAGVDAGAKAEEERSAVNERPSFGRVAVIHNWLTGMRGGG